MTNSSTDQLGTSNENIGDSINDQNELRKYALVKWLENSQFDVNNEWYGRLTSVPHSNIIDLDIDELKVGMEISVFRNCGEIWRAQVIIPKTSSTNMDVPTNTPRLTKVKSKTHSQINEKFNDHIEVLDHSPSSFLNDFDDRTPSTPLLNPTLMLLTTPNSTTSPGLELNNTTNKLNKELQYLQKAINDAGLTDFYQTSSQNNDPLASLTSQSPLLSSNCFKTNYNYMTSNGTCVENVLKIQNELLEQQKELRNIEMETLEQLKLLQYNLNRLAKKFDSFEAVILNNNSNITNGLINSNFINTNNNLKTTKTNLNNKLNCPIQQIKVVK
ncbi:hypothetical protein BpHYR1_000748 [Brachionus plicatilis]|uniref:Uncharacterized protein n=1 Tax=Brachionus plicatilis TaxID=10195 RepID=A0A3M7S3H9_BRAPC|nr:hypothetical protein BpHYR1_000748 [Brachionus plicatilis]